MPSKTLDKMNEQLFVFDSTGGCPLCDSKDGEYTTLPSRPHPYCDCHIYSKQSSEGDCFEIEYEDFETYNEENDFSDHTIPFTLKIIHRITCKDDYEMESIYEEDIDGVQFELWDKDNTDGAILQQAILFDAIEAGFEKALEEAQQECDCIDEDWRCC